MTKYVCIHGHFYQPPREEPWLEEIEFQESAFPYHDWNERITAECYFPNAYARRVDENGFILEIVNNYKGISFNFGPTLLLWLKTHKPALLQKIIEADKQSCVLYNAHGNAIAQVYNHVIMPLANTRDKITQVKWGIEAFKYFFGRHPEGMWLAETAVDNETLAIMAKEGIKFTILAPRQAAQVRPLAPEKPGTHSIWCPVDETTLDITHPYRCHPSKDTAIDIFFYHGPLSQGVSFGGLLQNGDLLARQIEAAFYKDGTQLVSIATDGETYGHHWKFSEMALAYLIYYFSHHPQIKLSNFSHFLAQFPPAYEVMIKENTSWSCVHGVGRWERDCGCNTGAHPEWNQKWRKPLRETLNWLRDEIELLFEKEGSRYFHDPWAARNDYIKIILNPSAEVKATFWSKHGHSRLNREEKITALKLLEMQYYAQLMFTSCGWFFDDISGLEPRQNLHYAARVIQLAQDFGMNLEEGFLWRIKEAKSNLPEYGNGAQIYRTLIKPYIYNFERLAVHFSFNHISETPPSRTRFYTVEVEVKEHAPHQAGGCLLLFNHLVLTHRRTEETKELLSTALHLGGLDLLGAVSPPTMDSRKELEKLFADLSFYEIKDRLESLPFHYGIHDIFFDDRRKLALSLVDDKLQGFQNTYASFYEENKGLMFALKGLHIPLPPVFLAIAQNVLEEKFFQEYQKELAGQKNQLQELLKEAKTLGIEANSEKIKILLEDFIKENLEEILRTLDINRVKVIHHALSLCQACAPHINLWAIQNIFWNALPRLRAHYKPLPDEIISLGRQLKFKLEQ
ncbi:MAG: DUF3536 domain-containing protein [Candidatus Desulfofervidaceae bacterium]|nr:DUF3536 domain-containing protein [Candidatus Desulfofervidaceae bacterium]